MRVHLSHSLCWDRYYFKKCAKCSSFGHYKDECRNKFACRYCAEEHDSASCPVKNNGSLHKCSNCKMSKKSHIKSAYETHAASSRNCPLFVEQEKRIIANTLWSTTESIIT